LGKGGKGDGKDVGSDVKQTCCGCLVIGFFKLAGQFVFLVTVQVAAGIKLSSQLVPGPMEPDLDRFERYAEYVCDLLVF
jgi:hypothetical protein